VVAVVVQVVDLVVEVELEVCNHLSQEEQK
jgi:hypothetical protein